MMVERAHGSADGGAHGAESEVRELSARECWERLRGASVARLAVVVDGHPDIFPISITVDHGAIVLRTAEGTKLSGALSGPVAVESDGIDEETHHAWSVVAKGKARVLRRIDEVTDSFSLSLFPLQAGAKPVFISIEPTSITGRRFPAASPDAWRSGFGAPTSPEL